MAKDDQNIPNPNGKHHTWGTAESKKYKGQHRASDRKADKDQDEKK